MDAEPLVNQAPDSWRIRIEPSGQQFEAQGGETLLQGALRQGVMLPHNCGNGSCGSCRILCVSGDTHAPAAEARALSDAQRAEGFILACQAQPRSDLVLHSERVGHTAVFPARTMPARVASLQRLADDVMQIRLQHAGAPLAFHAGQHVLLTLADGTARAYSLANAPMSAQGASRELELHVRHMPQGRFSGQVFESMKARDMLKLSGPLGGFHLDESSNRPLIFLASGTGFAPIKAMLEHLAWRGLDRSVQVYWGGRRRADIYLMDWMREHVQAHPGVRFHPVLSEATAQDAWTGRAGLVHRAVLEDCPDLSGHEVYACGAPVMVEAARQDFTAQAGLPASAFFADAFVASAPEAQPEAA